MSMNKKNTSKHLCNPTLTIKPLTHCTTTSDFSCGIDCIDSHKSHSTIGPLVFCLSTKNTELHTISAGSAACTMDKNGFFLLIPLMVQKSGYPVEVGSLSHYLQGFYTPQVVSRISEPSRVHKSQKESKSRRYLSYPYTPIRWSFNGNLEPCPSNDSTWWFQPI